MRKAVLCLLTGVAMIGVQPSAYAQGFSLFPGNGGQSSGSQVVQTQATDPSLRIMQLEEQVRDLTGQMEDLNFQMLQMEEKLRKVQQDMEFRLQDIENGTSSSGSGQNMTAPPSSDGSGSVNNGGSKNTTPSTDAQTQGNAGSNGLPPAAQNDGDDAQFYKTAYELILAGDYPQAEQAFGEFVLSYPDSALIPDASFWLGESMLAQQKYNDAARTFLNAYKAYGDSDKAPEMLLKLGQSLAGLDNKDAACATFSEVPVRYPDAAQAVLNKAKSEMSDLGC